MPATKEQCRKYKRKLRERAWDAIGRLCYFCEKPADHMAHVKVNEVKGEGRGAHTRYRHVVKHPEHYRPMCKRCHRRYDALPWRDAFEKPTTYEDIPF